MANHLFEANAVCDVCGFEYKHSELRERWDGLRVCETDWELRHPMDFQRIPRTEKALPWTRPQPDDVFGAGDSTNLSREDVPTYVDTVEDVPSSTFNISDPIGS